MSEQRPPWFPGQFGRRDDAATGYTGDPYAEEPAGAEPYAPSTLNNQVTNPYGDVPAPPPAPSAGSSEIPDGAAAPTAQEATPAPSAAKDATTAQPTAQDSTPAARTAQDATPAARTDAPNGYEDFYQPGTLDRADLRRPRGRRRRRGSAARRRAQRTSAREHGPRPGRRSTRRAGLSAAAAVDSAGAADAANAAHGAGAADVGAADESTVGTSVDRGQRADVVPGGAASREGGTGAQNGRGRRSLLMLVLAGVVASFLFGVAAGLDDEPEPRTTASPAPSPTATPATTPAPTPDPLPSPTAPDLPAGEVAVSATVADGPFEVEIVGVSTGLTELTGSTATTTAEGEYVVVRLRVTATDPEPSYFVDVDQRLVDADGAEHEADPRAAMAVDGNQLWFAELDQGETAEGVVVFDVPAGTVPATFVMRASDESPGVGVDLPSA